jgi:hypothetical protein
MMRSLAPYPARAGTKPAECYLAKSLRRANSESSKQVLPVQEPALPSPEMPQLARSILSNTLRGMARTSDIITTQANGTRTHPSRWNLAREMPNP